LCLLRQASEAAASSDELLRQLADREERACSKWKLDFSRFLRLSSCLRSQWSHRSSSDGGSSEGTSCRLAVGDGNRRKKTLATGALKVDCDSWKRRCRALEAAIASSADWSSPREFV
uniref:DUF630 domain-containing protein n=1 Tax=Macrostomum lignano TaxID=282301 RepID=A0A1I8IMV5_9PLAT